MQRIESASRLGVSAGRAAQGAGDPAGGTLPRGHAGVGIGGRPHSVQQRMWNGNMPGLALAAGWCRHWPRRHVPRVAWARVPPFAGGVF
jgi:hypothetical protein